MTRRPPNNRRASLAASLGLALAGACRPAASAPTAPPPRAPAPAAEDPVSSPPPPRERDEPRPNATAAGLPYTCELELELLGPSPVKGSGDSAVSSREAKDKAWREACAALHQASGDDCHDRERVSVASETSRSFFRSGDQGLSQRFEHTVVLVTSRRARGFGDAPTDREQACARAKAHACHQLVHGPCPATGVRVLTVDGRPPKPPTPPPPRSGPRPTI